MKYKFKRTNIVLIVCCILVAVTTLTVVLHNDSPKLATKNNFHTLQQVVSSLKDGIGGEWRDTSSCTLIEPRLYGDQESYTCNVQYSRTTLIDSQSSIKNLIDSQVVKLRKHANIISIQNPSVPTFNVDSKDQFHLSQFGSGGFELAEMYSYDQNCGLSYELIGAESADSSLRQSIGCFISTQGIYLSQYDRV